MLRNLFVPYPRAVDCAFSNSSHTAGRVWGACRREYSLRVLEANVPGTAAHDSEAMR